MPEKNGGSACTDPLFISFNDTRLLLANMQDDFY